MFFQLHDTILSLLCIIRKKKIPQIHVNFSSFSNYGVNVKKKTSKDFDNTCSKSTCNPACDKLLSHSTIRRVRHFQLSHLSHKHSRKKIYKERTKDLL